jgi:mannan endo-1,4-beta-mannosidase
LRYNEIFQIILDPELKNLIIKTGGIAMKFRMQKIFACILSFALVFSTFTFSHAKVSTTESTTSSDYSYTFDSDVQGWSKEAGYMASFGDPAVEYSKDLENGSLKVNAVLDDDSQSWQELRICKDGLVLDQANAVSFDMYLDLSKIDASKYGSCTVKPYLVLDPDWAKTGMGANSKTINELEKVTINGKEFAKFTVKNVISGTGKTKLYIAFVSSNIKYTGPIYFDNIKIFKMTVGNAPAPEVLPKTTKSIISTKNFSTADVNLADVKASKLTTSLFAYLKGVGGKNILFGHQHDTTTGATTDGTPDGVQSDTKNTVGQYPAVYGWDTLSLVGNEPPGKLDATAKENGDALIKVAKKAYERGGIITLSSHMPNFVTGGNFNDTSEKAVARILPGGDKNSEFNAYLDRIAYFAKNLKDSKGNLIPVIYRPFHENTGDWFWWGAAHCTADQYKNIYRYTVEYLRDVKGVHNFLYAYSPSSNFSSESDYLTRYPGDEYVDILGFDEYDNNPSTSQDTWMQSIVNHAEIVTAMADKRGKVAAITETGLTTTGKLDASINPNWYEELLKVLKDSAEKGKNKTSYMLVWANFGLDQIWVPYRNHALLGNHPLMQDFINFYNDDFAAFGNSLKGVYNLKVKTSSEKPYMYIQSPTTGDTIKGAATITAKVFPANKKVTSVVCSIGKTSIKMTKGTQNSYAANWQPSVAINGTKIDITVKVKYSDGKTQQQIIKNVKVYADIPVKQYSFGKSAEGASFEGIWSPEGSSVAGTVAYDKTVGKGSVKINATFIDDKDSTNWTYQELKVKLPIGKTIDMSKVNKLSFDILLPSAVPDSLFKPYVMLYKSQAPGYQKYGEGNVQIQLKDFKQDTYATGTNGKMYRYTVTVDLTDQAAATDIVFGFVANDWNYKGNIYIDNVKLINAAQPPKQDPAIVDDFESYENDTAALKSAYNSAGDGVAISFADNNKGKAGKFTYSIGANAYAGAVKAMNGVDWSKFNALSFWMTPDGLNQRMVVQIKANGVSFEAYPSLADKTAKNVIIKFSDFKPAPWEANQSARFTENLSKIETVGIYFNQVDGYKGTSSILLDDIKAIYDSSIVSAPSDNSETTQSGIPFDFEKDTASWSAKLDYKTDLTTSVSTDWASAGKQSLKTDITLKDPGAGNVSKYVLQTNKAVDLTGMKTLSADVKGVGNFGSDFGVKIFIQTGSGWTWVDGGYVKLTSDSKCTLTLDLSSVKDLNQVKAIGVEFDVGTGCSGSASLYIDNVTAK